MARRWTILWTTSFSMCVCFFSLVRAAFVLVMLFLCLGMLQLHPTFHPSRIRIDAPPFELARIGWGVFNVGVSIYLKPPYSSVTVRLSSLVFIPTHLLMSMAAVEIVPSRTWVPSQSQQQPLTGLCVAVRRAA
jgi:hypothetical protein